MCSGLDPAFCFIIKPFFPCSEVVHGALFLQFAGGRWVKRDLSTLFASGEVEAERGRSTPGGQGSKEKVQSQWAKGLICSVKYVLFVPMMKMCIRH